MRILFAGTPSTAIPALRALLASHHEVVGVLTRPDARKGRGKRLAPSPVAEVAEEAGVPVLKYSSLKSEEARQDVLALGAEAAAVVAYGALVPPALLDAFPWVNLHFSLLPRWRGAAPVPRAIEAGDTETGAMAFLLEEGLDTGPVLATIRRPIGRQKRRETSSRRSLSGGTGSPTTLRRWYRSSRKLPSAMAFSSSALVAAIRRISKGRSLTVPTGR